jgi:Eco57I restriction-modification methylase
MKQYVVSDILRDIDNIYKSPIAENVRNLIAENFVPTKEETETNAEVSTPFRLVEKMLDTIPQEFWNTPKKIFEPCCGKGNFVLGIFDKFYYGLINSVPNARERCKIIMTACIYYSDLSEINVFITSEIMKRHIKMLTGCTDIEYIFNSSTGDTLIINIKDVFKVDKFDAVIGNPPYSKFKNGLKIGYGGKSLWDKFVICSLQEWLQYGGYLLFIHPPSWRKPEHYLWNIISRKQIVSLKSLTEKEGKTLFGCATPTDCYLLKNVEIYMATEFEGQDNNHYSIDLRDKHFLPSGCIKEIFNISLKRKHDTNLNVIYSRSFYGTDKSNISPNESSTHFLPIIHCMTKQRGIGLVYSDRNNGHFCVPKIILSFGRNQYPYNDWEGKYGMSQSCFGLEIDSKEEGDNMIKAINSDKFKEVLKYTKWNTFQTEWRMFKHFKRDFWKEFI